jgi:cellulose synthase/poly-beta-1,6-N-acetylglucosamine synthase-like glycosyltransferase
MIEVWLEAGLFFLKLFWLLGLVPAVANVLGLILYGSPERTNAANLSVLKCAGWSAAKKLVVTYVSRGDNDLALARSIRKTRAVLIDHVVHFDIEVVTDVEVASKIAPIPNVHFVVVPESYISPSGAKWKARALSYLLKASRVRTRADGSRDGVWILHMDEESQLTPEALAGIHRFINAPENTLKIGQGEIKYNAYRYGEKTLIAAMDSLRTGEDLGRFRLQFKLFGRAPFGMHGSFILVPALVEDVIGFDLGGRGSVTEDAYFALKATEKGYRFGWVDGFIREQSPYTIVALMRQRRRWFCGLRLLASDPTIRWVVRLPLAVNVFVWRWMWVGVLAAVMNVTASGSYFPVAFTALATATGVATAAGYLVGAYRNQRDIDIPALHRIRIYAAIAVLMPLMGVIENAAIVWALLKPVEGFDVVDKN